MNSSYIDILKAGWTICTFVNDDLFIVHVTATRRNGDEDMQVAQAEVPLTQLEDRQLSHQFWKDFEEKCRTFALPEL